MMFKDRRSKKVFSLLFMFGIVNISLAFGVFYYSSVFLLEERASEQMDSVRALASEKLRLYFMHLKSSAMATSDNGVFTEITIAPEMRDSLVGIYQLNADPELIFGQAVPETNLFNDLPRNSIEMLGQNKLALKTRCRKNECVLIFSYQGVNEILSEKSGLGKTGEIYLVGPDNWIRSASRHLVENKSAKVTNDSIRFGNENKYGVHKVNDYRNVEVLSAFSPFVFDGLNFVILSEIDRREVTAAIGRNLPAIGASFGVLLLLTFILALYSGRKIISLADERKS